MRSSQSRPVGFPVDGGRRRVEEDAAVLLDGHAEPQHRGLVDLPAGLRADGRRSDRQRAERDREGDDDQDRSAATARDRTFETWFPPLKN